MASIRQEILIAVPPAAVWAAVRDVGAVHRRLVPGYALDARLEGDVRILTVPGGEVRELIVDVDDARRRLAYAVTATRMALTHHHASFQVFARGAGHSLLVWIADILPHAAAPEVRADGARGGRDQGDHRGGGPTLRRRTGLRHDTDEAIRWACERPVATIGTPHRQVISVRAVYEAETR